MIDPMLSLALSVESNPGVYAVLLGSGVSRSAGIPTGWEVVLDLIRKVAVLENADCEPDPAAWYKARHGEDPDYAKLLDALAHSPSERSQLLRGYFEPTDEEREQGLKVPTRAHTAISDLVEKGCIRVIVTTNFDHLMEDALRAKGVNPTVVSTADAIKGAPPLTHSKCTVIKLHGDYLDSRIKNTPNELARYDHVMNHELDRILDEFGLIICGWSAEWDTALRAGIERAKSRRYTTYWTLRGDPSPQVERLIALRGAQVLTINGADSFFQDLSAKVQALQDLNRPHPLSAKVAAETVKRYLVDDRFRIRLYDLAINEATRLIEEISEARLQTSGISWSPRAFERRIHQYEALAETMLAVIGEGCYWGTQGQADLWGECLERIADATSSYRGDIWTYSRLYVPTLLLYVGGISALIAQRYDTLVALLAKPTIYAAGKEVSVLDALSRLWTYEVFKHYVGLEANYTSVSDRLFAVLRKPLHERLPNDVRYQQYFDQFEYLLALVFVGQRRREAKQIWAPIGCFAWRNRLDPETSISKRVKDLLARSDLGGQLVRVGLFDDEKASLRATKEALDSLVARFRDENHIF